MGILVQSRAGICPRADADSLGLVLTDVVGRDGAGSHGTRPREAKRADRIVDLEARRSSAEVRVATGVGAFAVSG